MLEFINLKNKNKIGLIRDVVMHPLKVNKDESGVLVETLRNNWPEIYGPGREFAMQYYSITPSGLARDEDVWHFHPTVQEDRFCVISGEIIAVVADKRDGSETKDTINLFHMKAQEDPYLLLVPKNTLHGFLVISKEPAILINFPTAMYNPEEEGRMSFNQAGVKMPDGIPFSWDLVRKALPEKNEL
jgi:dTDP-4-dehydrorhamnose 3,5-epimerase